MRYQIVYAHERPERHGLVLRPTRRFCGYNKDTGNPLFLYPAWMPWNCEPKTYKSLNGARNALGRILDRKGIFLGMKWLHIRIYDTKKKCFTF